MKFKKGIMILLLLVVSLAISLNVVCAEDIINYDSNVVIGDLNTNFDSINQVDDSNYVSFYSLYSNDLNNYETNYENNSEDDISLSSTDLTSENHKIIYVSNTGSDSNNGSKESPVATINKAISLATINNVSNHIILNGGIYKENKLNINSTTLIIEGDGIGKSIIDASGKDGEIFNNYLSNLTLKNLSLINSINSESGGAIVSRGNLTLNQVRINNCSSNRMGGAISSIGVLVINNSIISNNSGIIGGAIYANSSNSNNSGISIGISSLSISNTTFDSNVANGSYYGGGAIYMQKIDGKKNINNTQFINNSAVAGGAIFMVQSTNQFLIQESSFINNSANGVSEEYGGGAINLFGSTYSTIGDMYIYNSIFLNNSASNTTSGGGAVFDKNVNLYLFNSIIADNYDGNNVSIYKYIIPYLTDVNVICYNDWWGTNDPSSLINVNLTSWVIMTIYGEKNPCYEDNIFYNVSLDKLNNGSSFTDNLPVYTTKIKVNDDNLVDLNISSTSNVTFNYTFNRVINYTIKAISLISGNEENSVDVNVMAKFIPMNISFDNATYDGVICGSINGQIVDGVANTIINDITYNGTINNNNNKFLINITGLSGGNYSNVSIYLFSADGKYKSNSTFNIIVNKIDLHIDAPNLSGKTSEKLTVPVTVKDDNNNLVNCTLDYYLGSNYIGNVSVINGNANVIFKNFNKSSNYILTFVFKGNSNYNPNSSKCNLSIDKSVTQFINPSSGTIYNGNYFTVTLCDSNYNILSSEKVSITILGKTYTVTTDKNGLAKVKLTFPSKYLSKNIKVSYKFVNLNAFFSSKGSAVIKVVKKPTKISRITKSTLNNYGYFYVNLTDNVGKVLPSKIISVKSYLSGKIYKIKTNAKGIAKIKLWVSPTALGKYYSFKFNYEGSKYYKPYSVTFKVKFIK